MPIQTFAAFKRRTDFAGMVIPQALLDLLTPIKDDDAKVRQAGTQYVADMCRKIIDADLGIHGVHCCLSTLLLPSRQRLTSASVDTMNLSRGTEMLLEELQFFGSADRVKPYVSLLLQISPLSDAISFHSLPWRLSLTKNRRTETTRPIFWSNRQRSYVSRTADWDEVRLPPPPTSPGLC